MRTFFQLLWGLAKFCGWVLVWCALPFYVVLSVLLGRGR